MPTKTEPAQEKKSKAVPIVLSVFGVLLACYLGFAAWLRIDGRFPFRTALNGTDVSLKRAIDVQRTCMENYYPNMRFTITPRSAAPYSVAPASFDFSGAARAVSFLPKSTLTWPRSLFADSSYFTSDGGAIGKLARRIERDCPAFRADRWEEPQNAALLYDESAGLFTVAPETPGTAIDTQKFETALEEHILRGRGDLDLSDAGVYRSAEVRSSSSVLLDTAGRLNRFLNAEVVFTEGEVTEVFSAHVLAPYLSVDPDTLAASYDASAAAADGIFDGFAAELSEALAPPGGIHDFITHDGVVVPVTEKTWREELDPAATAEALSQLTFDDLSSAEEPISGTLVWAHPALDALTNYVEVDLTNQMLYLYTDGALVLETPVVSGNVAQHHTTPGGAFTLMGKYRNVTLRGPDYASFVRYWMPFNNKIGLHDAGWRSRFGGTIYQTNGSHGCVNLPRDAAETIFNTIDESYAIVCYWRPTT